MKPASKGKSDSSANRNVPAVQEKKGGSVVPFNYGAAGGVGLENAGREDFAIPFLQILQKLSPQCDRKNPAHLDGASDGMILNTATGELFEGDEGVLVIPCFYRRAFVAWILREKGGGFKGEYQPEDPVIRTTRRDDRGREMIPNSDVHLVDTRIFGVLVIGDGGSPSPAILTMASTQLKKAKKWCTQMNQLQAEEARTAGQKYPIFAHAYRLTTVGESNDRGNWSGWVVTHEGLLHEALKGPAGQEAFNASMDFYRSLSSGEIKLRADAPHPEQEAGERM